MKRLVNAFHRLVNACWHLPQALPTPAAPHANGCPDCMENGLAFYVPAYDQCYKCGHGLDL